MRQQNDITPSIHNGNDNFNNNNVNPKVITNEAWPKGVEIRDNKLYQNGEMCKDINVIVCWFSVNLTVSKF